MTDPQLPSDNGKRKLTTTRIVLWVVGAAVAIYLITSGIIGVISKGQ